MPPARCRSSCRKTARRSRPAATCCSSSIARTRAASPTRPRRRSFDVFDAFFLVDHCVALLGAVDAMRLRAPRQADVPRAVHRPRWTSRGRRRRSARRSRSCARSSRSSPARRSRTRPCRTASAPSTATGGCCARSTTCAGPAQAPITARQMQVLVKSSMVMDIDEHNAILDRARRSAGRAARRTGRRTWSSSISRAISATRRGRSCSTRSRSAARWSSTTTSTPASVTSRPTSPTTSTRSKR